MRHVLLLVFAILIVSCEKNYHSDPLPNILDSNHPAIKTVMDNLDAHEVQIKVSELIEWNTGNLSSLTYEFQVDDNNYFYPASSVKFPIAVLALEKVNSIEEINSETPFVINGDSVFSSIRDNVKAIFAISDNVAYNRLYDFLGRDYINNKLKEKGLQPAQISHRLESGDAENAHTKPILFKVSDSMHYVQPSLLDSEIEPLQLHRIKKGKGYYKNNNLVNEPMDFSGKNYLPISTLHEMMKRVRYPDAFEFEKQFVIGKDDQKFLLEAMKTVPRKVGYDESDYHDGYVKFFMFGDTMERIPEDLDISNKVGYAYGYLTDCALIEDRKHGIFFF